MICSGFSLICRWVHRELRVSQCRRWSSSCKGHRETADTLVLLKYYTHCIHKYCMRWFLHLLLDSFTLFKSLFCWCCYYHFQRTTCIFCSSFLKAQLRLWDIASNVWFFSNIMEKYVIFQLMKRTNRPCYQQIHTDAILLYLNLSYLTWCWHIWNSTSQLHCVIKHDLECKATLVCGYVLY